MMKLVAGVKSMGLLSHASVASLFLPVIHSAFC